MRIVESSSVTGKVTFLGIREKHGSFVPCALVYLNVKGVNTIHMSEVSGGVVRGAQNAIIEVQLLVILHVCQVERDNFRLP